MTVVVALRCADGIVIGGDSQITDPGRELSYPAQKLHPLGPRAAWAGSGSRAVLGDVKKRLDAAPETVTEAEDLGRALQAVVVPVLRHHYENFVADVPGGPGGATPATYLLAAGYRGDEPFIVDVDPHGLVGDHVDTGFHAIGSGAAMAQQAGALLSHFRMTERSVDHGVMAVLRVLDALDTVAPSVGPPMDVCRITAEGARHLSVEETDAVRRRVGEWVAAERRLLDDLFD